MIRSELDSTVCGAVDLNCERGKETKMTADKSESKHTPGPWHVGAHIIAHGEKGGYYPIETTQGETDGYIARVYMAGKPTVGQAYGDAALIAAAPETLRQRDALLEMAETCVRALPSVLAACPKKTHVLQSYKDCAVVVERFRAAIARAKRGGACR